MPWGVVWSSASWLPVQTEGQLHSWRVARPQGGAWSCASPGRGTCADLGSDMTFRERQVTAKRHLSVGESSHGEGIFAWRRGGEWLLAARRNRLPANHCCLRGPSALCSAKGRAAPPASGGESSSPPSSVDILRAQTHASPSLDLALTSRMSLGCIMSEPSCVTFSFLSSHLILPSAQPLPYGTSRLREVKCFGGSPACWRPKQGGLPGPAGLFTADCVLPLLRILLYSRRRFSSF